VRGLKLSSGGSRERMTMTARRRISGENSYADADADAFSQHCYDNKDAHEDDKAVE
jgi:hypothetical protein